MPRKLAFVARLYLDLDTGLVDTHVEISDVEVANLCVRLAIFRAWGQISPGRVLLAIYERDGSQVLPVALAPLCSKEQTGPMADRWNLCPWVREGLEALTSFDSNRALELFTHAASVSNRGENRGPILWRSH